MRRNWKGFTLIGSLNISGIILLFAWISFFPQPIQQKYALSIKFLLALNLIILLFRNPKSTLKLSDYPLWIFLTAISINIFLARERSAALKTYSDIAIPLFCIYYLISVNFSEKKNFHFLTNTVVISSSLVSLFAIFETLFAFNPVYEYLVKNPYYARYIYGFVRPMSTQYNPTALGGYLAGCLPFSYLLLKRKGRYLSLLGAIGMVLSATVIMLTCSRGAFLGMAAAVIFYLFVQKRYRLIFIFLIFLSSLFLIFSYLPYPLSKLSAQGAIKDYRPGNYRLENPAIIKERDLPKGEDPSAFGISWIFDDSVLSAYRMDRWDMARRIIRDYPWAGIGLNHFRIRFYEYYPGENKTLPEIMVADNMYLTLLAETGAIGFLGFMIYILSLFARGIKSVRLTASDPEKRQNLLIGLTALVGLLVNMAGYEFFYWHNQFMLFCFVTGCINASLRYKEE